MTDILSICIIRDDVYVCVRTARSAYCAWYFNFFFTWNFSCSFHFISFFFSIYNIYIFIDCLVELWYFFLYPFGLKWNPQKMVSIKNVECNRRNKNRAPFVRFWIFLFYFNQKRKTRRMNTRDGEKKNWVRCIFEQVIHHSAIERFQC